MSFFSPSIGYTGVRPELDCIVEYIPGESLEAFSKRTRIPLHQLVNEGALFLAAVTPTALTDGNRGVRRQGIQAEPRVRWWVLSGGEKA